PLARGECTRVPRPDAVRPSAHCSPRGRVESDPSLTAPRTGNRAEPEVADAPARARDDKETADRKSARPGWDNGARLGGNPGSPPRVTLPTSTVRGETDRPRPARSAGELSGAGRPGPSTRTW